MRMLIAIHQSGVLIIFRLGFCFPSLKHVIPVKLSMIVKLICHLGLHDLYTAIKIQQNGPKELKTNNKARLVEKAMG